MNETKYVTYLRNDFDANYFFSLPSLKVNRINKKPVDALWGSLLDEPDDYYSWRLWATSEDFYDRPMSQLSKVVYHLKDSARIYQMYTKKDFQRLRDKFPARLDNYFGLDEDKLIDWQKVAEYYDVIDFRVRNLYWELYTWDCDCICILNKDCIVLDGFK